MLYNSDLILFETRVERHLLAKDIVRELIGVLSCHIFFSELKNNALGRDPGWKDLGQSNRMDSN